MTMDDENPYVRPEAALRHGRRPAVTLDTYEGPGYDEDNDEPVDLHDEYDHDAGLSGYDTHWSY